ncbi:class I SAM-dependent methyltransferase [Exiguobacterium marinum]|uniref:Class I SAM-dependent methyltransferase n=1 Tax=Exiguobacterium marinum TaxID=273528 RepID=A0ABY7X278_9BACL|nr:class I SAM-dependent methyltransferase [Exiguobacterium marinum]WDH77215.1 class I SAM-dependent methyltransferase [Exiguobacterium marinum]
MYIVTTCLRPTDEVLSRAHRYAAEYKLKFVDRRKHSIDELKKRHHQDVLVFDKRRVEYTPLHSTEPFFFHPSSSVFRVKQLSRGGTDPLIDALQATPGDRMLDCTLGLGSDSIVMSHAVGTTGKVVGIESQFITAQLVREGMAVWVEKDEHVTEAMRRIEVVHANSLDYLKTCAENSFDCIYFDPMFEKTISESVHLNPLRSIADTSPLTQELIAEAKRVAKKRIVLKAHFESDTFERYGFTHIKRKTSKFHYGYIDLESKSI